MAGFMSWLENTLGNSPSLFGYTTPSPLPTQSITEAGYPKLPPPPQVQVNPRVDDSQGATNPYIQPKQGTIPPGVSRNVHAPEVRTKVSDEDRVRESNKKGHDSVYGMQYGTCLGPARIIRFTRKEFLTRATTSTPTTPIP